MAKKLLSKRNLKKLNKAMENPIVRYVGGSLFSMAAVGALKILAEKFPEFSDLLVSSDEERKRELDKFYSENEVQI